MMDDGWAPSRSPSIAMRQGTRQLDAEDANAGGAGVSDTFKQGNNAEVR